MNLRDRFRQWMVGRYGQDDLSRFMLWTGIVCMFLNMFLRSGFLQILWLVLLVLVYVRMFSKNTSARYEENRKYLEIRDKVTTFFRDHGITDFFRRIGDFFLGIPDFFRNLFGKGGNSQSGNYHIYRCPKCGQKIRIPRGKGKIVITCPRCRTEFRKRS